MAAHRAVVMRHPIRGDELWVATCVECEWYHETVNLLDVVEEMDQHTAKASK